MRAARRHALVFILASLLGAGFASAQRMREPIDSTLAGHTLPGDRLIVSPAVVQLSESQTKTALSVRAATAWQQFRSAAGPSWQAWQDRRSGAIHYAEGSGVAWLPGRGNRLATPTAANIATLEGVARSFLAQRSTLLDVDPQSLALNQGRSGQVADYLWLVDFDLVRGGLPVEGARVFFRVNNGNLIQFGSENLPAAATPTPGFLFDRQQALDRLASFIGGLQPGDRFIDRGSQHLAVANRQDLSFAGGFAPGSGYDIVAYWQFKLHRDGEPGTWRGRVDATTGQVLEFVDSNEYSQASGGVFQGDRPSPEVVLPMPFADLSTGGFTDAAGLYEFTGNATSSTLSGQFVRIVDAQCGAIFKPADASGEILFGASAGTDCAIPAAGGGAGNTHAARTQFYNVNRNKDVARGWLPGNTWLDQRVDVRVNLNQTCNAYWDGVALNFFQSGGGCSNTGELPGVSLHEYGHGLDANDGNGDSPDFGSAETYGDFTAALATHSSCIGNGFLPGQCSGYGAACTACTGVRDIDYAKRAGNTPHTVNNFTRTSCPTPSANNPNYVGPCGINAIALGFTKTDNRKREGHCESYVSSEALWDIANRDLPNPGSGAAWTTIDRLWYLSRPTTTADFRCDVSAATWTSDGCTAGSLFRTFRAVDDDDGNLANGTPHGAAIAAAFNRHGIACTSDPAWNVTFAGCTPPNSTALTTSVTDVSVGLSWPSSGPGVVYDLYRNEAGCSAGFTKIANDVAATSYIDTNVGNGLTYHYQIVPQPPGNEACAAPPSACVSAAMPTFPGNPTLTAVTSVGNNQVKLDWTPGTPPSSLFRILRAEGTCASPGIFAIAATAVAGTTFTDPLASSGTSYAYEVSGERSGPSNCLDITPVGNCLLAPTSTGLSMATNSETATCGISLAWSAGTSRCAGTLGYNVYRGTAATFTPAPGNLLAASVAGTSYDDTSGNAPGTRYYYVVRAVDLGNGASDSNLVRKSTFATGPFAAASFTESFEAATGGGFDNPGWSHSAAGVAPLIDWVQSSTYAQAGSQSFFADEADHLNERSLVSPVFKLSATTTVTFSHKWRLETPAASCFDAATLELAAITSEVWLVPAAGVFTLGGPSGTANAGNALAGERAWCGASTNFTTAFQTATLALGANYPGSPTIQLRWHSADDSGATNASSPRGWFVDNVQITNALFPASCSAQGMSFYALTPCRMLDTRDANGAYGGPSFGSGVTRGFLFAGQCGIPAGARAVSLNLTVVNPSAAGALNAYAATLAVPPGTSALSYKLGVTRANNAVVAIASDGINDVKITNSVPATLDVVVDVNGYFQ